MRPSSRFLRFGVAAIASIVLVVLIAETTQAATTYYCHDSWHRYKGDCGEGCTVYFGIFDKNDSFVKENSGARLQWVRLKWNVNPDTGYKVKCKCEGGTYNKLVLDDITVVQVEIDLAQSQACDGESVNVDLVVSPTSAENAISNVQFTATKPGGGTDFDNPSGQGITLSQRNGEILEWQIDNVRWYSTQGDHCNATSNYEITATYVLPGTECEAAPVTFTADSSFGTCMDGAATMTQIWSGQPTYTTQFNDETQLWEATVAQGTFQRDV